MRRLVLVALLLALAAPASAADRPLRIVFPEGFSSRQMVDRVAAVRLIAIRKRHVRPRLTGKAYAGALRAAEPPPGFGHPAGVEGFLFPSTYFFAPGTPASVLAARA